ncbi:MAG: hypothetical protein FJ020_10175, partial [Chloroflexi bacterium]|nr:hypothetical protein [Chloroflexota bacterium]
MRPIRLLLAGVMAGAFASVLAAGALPVAAGTNVDLAEIRVDEALMPGEVYQLPTVGVLNTGDRAGSYMAMIARASDEAEPVPYADWFQFEPQSFDLEPGASARVAVSLRLPADARAGDYSVLIAVHPVTGGRGATAGEDAAATRLHFSVKAMDGGFFQRTALHVYVALGLAAIVVLTWL